MLPYKSPMQPYVAYATTFTVSLVIFFSGKPNFTLSLNLLANAIFRLRSLLPRQLHRIRFLHLLHQHRDLRGYVPHPFFLKISMLTTLVALYIFFKIYLRSKIIPLEEIDFTAELESILHWRNSEENPMYQDEKFVKRVWNKIF